MAGIKGDFGAVKEFAKKIGKLKDASKLIGTAAAPRIESLLREQFGSGGDPYGEAWQPKKGGGAPFAGGDAEGWVTVRLVAGGKRIRTTLVPPGVFHQRGARHGRKARRKLATAMRKAGATLATIREAKAKGGGGAKLPARPLIPEEAKGIPPRWRDAILEEARKVMAAHGASEAK